MPGDLFLSGRKQRRNRVTCDVWLGTGVLATHWAVRPAGGGSLRDDCNDLHQGYFQLCDLNGMLSCPFHRQLLLCDGAKVRLE
ncbi:hypothetical protein CPAR01_14918 [Colletotrichum paranaense]|uniref:Rieske domain-containing protein n=1 Tax=Colletotrichum paranaense TaxID=1914294 RepID=A0ABQ9S095_9PEZI|nr:uncharacterized protein CPAR01_14918 [Colletotrichum paranaense]KAK1521395.1 hypothetical protein CPAR01_14918 [Colletotrichum paranaense]